MSSVVRTIQQASGSREEEFIRRYDFRFSRSLQLTKQEHVAEAVLHDEFVSLGKDWDGP